jgi:hypothetical protein
MLGTKTPVPPYVFETCVETDLILHPFTKVSTLLCFLTRLTVLHVLVLRKGFTFPSFLANLIFCLLFFTNLFFVEFSVGPECFHVCENPFILPSPSATLSVFYLLFFTNFILLCILEYFGIFLFTHSG